MLSGSRTDNGDESYFGESQQQQPALAARLLRHTFQAAAAAAGLLRKVAVVLKPYLTGSQQELVGLMLLSYLNCH